MLSRRRLLVTAGLLGVATAAGGLPGLAGPAGADLVEVLVTSTFTPLVGKSFHFSGPSSAPVTLVLRAVEGIGGAPVATRAFALRFSGPVAVRQGGEVGTFSGAGVPPMNLLVVPSGPPSTTGQDWVLTVQGGDGRV